MGLRVSWIGVKGADRSALLTSLGLAEPGGTARSHSGSRNALTGFERDGWFFVITGHLGFASRLRVATVSHHGPAVGAYLEEHVMVSGAFGASNGRLVWSAQHHAEFGREHLDVWGEPPSALKEIHARLIKEQRAETEPVDHLFDAPVELAASVCGFNADEWGDEDVDFVELQVVRRDLMKLREEPLATDMKEPCVVGPKTPPPKRGLLARLLGGR